MRAFVRVRTLGTRCRPDFRQSRSADHLRAFAMTSAAQGALAFGVTRVGIFGASSRSVHKTQLKHVQRSLWLRVRGSDSASRMVSIGEFEARQEAHNASTGSLVRFAKGRGRRWLRTQSQLARVGAACVIVASQLRGPLGPEHGVGHPSSGVGPCHCHEDELVDVLGGELGVKQLLLQEKWPSG